MEEKKDGVPKNISAYLSEMKETYRAFRWVWDELLHEEGKRTAKWMLVVFAIITLAFVLQPLGFAWIINGLEEKSEILILISIALWGLTLFIRHVCGLILQLLREWVLNRNIWQINSRANEMFTEKTLGQHIDDGSTLNFASLGKAINRIESIQEMIVFETSSMFLTLLLSYVLIFTISTVAGIVITCLLIIYFSWSLYLNYNVAVETTPISEESRRYVRELEERWEKIIRVKTNGKTVSESLRLRSWLLDIMKKDKIFWFWYIKNSFGRDTVAVLVRAGIILYGIYLVYIGDEKIGFLIPLYSWVTEVSQNLWYVGHAERRLNEQLPYIQRLRKALTSPIPFSESEGKILPNETPVSIRFDRVSLNYGVGENIKKPILRDISFSIAPGEKVALIGESGAGKTSIMKLLLRWMDPTEGDIWINGSRLKDLKLSSWMEKVGYIPQQAQIFDGTVRYNLTFGLSEERQRNITDEEILQTMRLVQIDFGEGAEKALKTRVGKDGMKLSGGEAQRVMIGAAVIKQPIFMGIDEATSALDSSTEKEVQRGFASALAGPVGALIIAHRLSTVRDICNRFLVLRPFKDDDSSINQIEAEASSFEELYKISPTFRRLADDQGVVI